MPLREVQWETMAEVDRLLTILPTAEIAARSWSRWARTNP